MIQQYKWMPVMYVTYFPTLQSIANEHGYALAVHGSVTRDFDLVAVPWVEKPKSHRELLSAIQQYIGRINSNGLPYDSITEKPHGRVAYTIGTGQGGYLDISIMPVL